MESIYNDLAQRKAITFRPNNTKPTIYLARTQGNPIVNGNYGQEWYPDKRIGIVNMKNWIPTRLAAYPYLDDNGGFLTESVAQYYERCNGCYSGVFDGQVPKYDIGTGYKSALRYKKIVDANEKFNLDKMLKNDPTQADFMGLFLDYFKYI